MKYFLCDLDRRIRLYRSYPEHGIKMEYWSPGVRHWSRSAGVLNTGEIDCRLMKILAPITLEQAKKKFPEAFL
jgi:hypothetical protein